MIKKLKIQNILSHKKSEFNFNPGVNIIIGKSDQGKSAALQGLYWLLNPVGEQHRSWWGGKTKSIIYIDDFSIELQRDKISKYILSKNDKKNEFKAFGQRPPEQIIELLNINEKINIQHQLDKEAPIFLLSEPPGNVAKFFNSIAGLDIIGQTIKIGKKAVKDTEKAIEIKKDLITEKQDELKDYQGIEKYNGLLTKAIKIEKRIESKNKIIDDINKLLKLYNKQSESLEYQKQITKIKPDIQQAENIHIDIEYNENRKNKIQRQLKEFENKIHLLEKYKIKLNIKNTLIQANKIKGYIEYTEKAKQQINNKIQSIIKYKQIIKELNTKIQELLKQIPETCPICGGELDETKIKR